MRRTGSGRCRNAQRQSCPGNRARPAIETADRVLAQYLKAKGRIAVIDFHPELGPHKNDPALQVTKDQARAWLAAMGFKPVEEYPLFTDKWFVVYAR